MLEVEILEILVDWFDIGKSDEGDDSKPLFIDVDIIWRELEGIVLV